MIIFLFIIVVDYVLRMAVDTINSKGYQLKERVSSRHPAKYLTDTDFADDIALISQSLADAESLLQSLEKASNSVGLYLNEKKTEYVNKVPTIVNTASKHSTAPFLSKFWTTSTST